jgi:hypothetical protein
MIEAGFSEKEAMEMSGHRTRYLFDRYYIVSERGLACAGSDKVSRSSDRWLS